MKVKMLEELVSRIDGKPASGQPAPCGAGTRRWRALGGRVRPHPAHGLPLRLAAGAGAAPLSLVQGTHSGWSAVTLQEVMSTHRKQAARSLLKCPVIVVMWRQRGCLWLSFGTLSPAFVHCSAIGDAVVISPWNPINYQVWKWHRSYYRKIKVCARPVLDYAFMFKWGLWNTFYLHP